MFLPAAKPSGPRTVRVVVVGGGNSLMTNFWIYLGDRHLQGRVRHPELFGQIFLWGGICDSKIRFLFGVGSIHGLQFIQKGGYYLSEDNVCCVAVFKHSFSFCYFLFFGDFVNAAGP